MEPFDLAWLEIDSYDAAALATIRRSARTRIASCESLFGRRQYRPFFEHQSVDVAIIDVPWNGILESVKIAAMADAYEVNVAPHNFNGHLGTLMGAHFCAAVPNFQVMEIDVDEVPWKDSLVTHAAGDRGGRIADPDRRRLGRRGQRGRGARAPGVRAVVVVSAARAKRGRTESASRARSPRQTHPQEVRLRSNPSAPGSGTGLLGV